MSLFPRTLLFAAVAASALAVTAAGATGTAAAAPTASCGKAGYAYAGHQNAQRAHGVRATLSALADPLVRYGHVAAWIGLGGPGQGPNGSDAWLQIGLSHFSWEAGSRLYYEVNRPGIGPQYKEVLTNVPHGERHRVAVLETAQRDWWRVWVDGRAVSPPLHLQGSSGRWRPIATAEAWDGGRGSCNRFSYSFEQVAVARNRGGNWGTFRSGHRFQDKGFRVLASRNGSFLARTSVLPPRPPKAKAARAPTTASAPASRSASAPTPTPAAARPVVLDAVATLVADAPPLEPAPADVEGAADILVAAAGVEPAPQPTE